MSSGRLILVCVKKELTHYALYFVWKCEQLAPKLTRQESEQNNDLNLFCPYSTYINIYIIQTRESVGKYFEVNIRRK